ncbi:MAG: hypothetical protein HQL80_04145 [Magnetococcales bacterium]|nr:hypothetical protein [Magnetococcales bacterium]
MDQIAQNARLAQWTVDVPIPDYWGPEYLGKPAPVSDIFDLLKDLKKGYGPQEILAGHAQDNDVENKIPCGPRKILAGHPCGPSNRLVKLAAISIHDRFLLAQHFNAKLKSKEAKSQLAIGRDYGLSGGLVRSICELLKLATQIQEAIGRMNKAEVAARVKFKELFDISQIKDHEEQRRRFEKMLAAHPYSVPSA